MSLRLVRRPNSPFWHIRGTLRRRRVQESTGVVERSVADEILIKRQAEILQESIHGRAATATFAEAVVGYYETGGKRRTGGSRRFMKKIVEHFGTTPLMKIDLNALERGAKKLYPNASPATVNRQFYTPTVAVLRHAAARGLCAVPIVERPTQAPTEPRWLTPDEAERLIACLLTPSAPAGRLPSPHRRTRRRSVVARLAQRRPC